MKQESMLTMPITKLYIRYLVPTLIAMVSSSMYCLADVYFISLGTGSTGLAALNISMPLFSLFAAIGLCFGVGGATIMAIAQGNQQPHLRNQAFTISLVSMLIIGAICSILGVIFADKIAYAFGSSKQLLPYVRQYMIPILAGSIIFIPMYSSSILMRADHAPSTAMKATLVGNLTNIVLDYVFVVILKQGLVGAAIATCIGSAFVLVLMIPHFVRKKNSVGFTKDILHMDILKRIMKNGFGSCIMEIGTACIVVIFNIIILYLADELFLAAFAIITNIAYVCRGLCNGFAQAAQPILSLNHGARQYDRVRKTRNLALCFALGFSIVTYADFLLFPKPFAALFANGNQALITLGAQGIRLYFVGLMFTSTVTVIMYYFQSIERGNFATILAIAKGFVFIILGFIVLLPTLHLNGIWLTTPFAECLALLLGLYLVYKAGKEDGYQ